MAEVVKFLFMINVVFAATGTINSSYPYAWGENVGWINFGTSEGNVTVTDTELTGYAWGENIGWISLNCSNTSSCGTVNYKVANTTTGDLSGYAWGENVGWINFDDVGIDSDGNFFDYAWGENIGWISLNCSNTSSCATVDFKLNTTWRPTAGSDPGPAPSSTPVPSSSASPLPTVSASVTPVPTATPSVSPSTTPIPTTSVVPTSTPFSTPLSTPVPTPITSSLVSPFPTPPSLPPSVTPTEGPAGPTFFPPVVDAVKKVITTSTVVAKSVSKPVSVVTGVAVAVSTAASAVSVASSGVSFINYVLFFLKNILVFFGIKRKTRAWGTIYNAVTKEPLPFTRVMLIGKDMRVLETRITDREGRYGFLSSPEGLGEGEVFEFSIMPVRDGFAFPSQRVTGTSDTVLYERVYNGGISQAGQNEVIKHDLPMDPLVLDKVSATRIPKVHLHNLFANFSRVIFWIALVAVPLNFIFHPTTLNLIFLILFVGLNLLVLAGDLQQRPYGLVLDRVAGSPVPYSLITLNDSNNQRKGFTVSDVQGRYFLLSDKGSYKLSVFTPAHVNPPRSSEERFSTDRGWIAKKLNL